jgi:hypothetical protein
MALSKRWLDHIEAWQSSGLKQSAYCRQHSLNSRTFAARLSDYRKGRGVPPLALTRSTLKTPPHPSSVWCCSVAKVTGWSCPRPFRPFGWQSCCDAWLDRESSTDLGGGGAG